MEYSGISSFYHAFPYLWWGHFLPVPVLVLHAVIRLAEIESHPFEFPTSAIPKPLPGIVPQVFASVLHPEQLSPFLPETAYWMDVV